jgi:hypothetical protein
MYVTLIVMLLWAQALTLSLCGSTESIREDQKKNARLSNHKARL